MKPNRLRTGPGVVSWEAVYEGENETLRQDEGGLYGEIERARLTSFRLVVGSDVLAEVITTDPYMFVYRRRTSISEAGERVYILFGDMASNLIAYDMSSGQVIMGRIGDSHPLVDFSPPIPHPDEGEMF